LAGFFCLAGSSLSPLSRPSSKLSSGLLLHRGKLQLALHPLAQLTIQSASVCSSSDRKALLFFAPLLKKTLCHSFAEHAPDHRRKKTKRLSLPLLRRSIKQSQ
jgi:hypothetical protein